MEVEGDNKNRRNDSYHSYREPCSKCFTYSISFIPPGIPWSRYYHPPFTEEKTKLRSHGARTGGAESHTGTTTPGGTAMSKRKNDSNCSTRTIVYYFLSKVREKTTIPSSVTSSLIVGKWTERLFWVHILIWKFKLKNMTIKWGDTSAGGRQSEINCNSLRGMPIHMTEMSEWQKFSSYSLIHTVIKNI